MRTLVSATTRSGRTSGNSTPALGVARAGRARPLLARGVDFLDSDARGFLLGQIAGAFEELVDNVPPQVLPKRLLVHLVLVDPGASSDSPAAKTSHARA